MKCISKIEISEKARDELRKHGHKGETYTSIILRLTAENAVDDGG